MKRHQSGILKFKHFVLCAVFFISAFCILNFCYALDITILYTGDTHAMLYTCSCPVETDGGIARRAALLAQLRKENPAALVVETGAFFAGGVLDEYSQNTELDMQRTIVNLKAMELMHYDAAAVGVNEFNFGGAFLEDQIKNTHTAFLSCNIRSEKLMPYLIKEVEGFTVGIVGVTSVEVMSKSGDLKLTDPKKALTQTIQELKQKKVDFIIVVSQLGREEDLFVLKDVAGIDVAILGPSNRNKEEAQGIKINSMIVVRPAWQGRHLSKLTLKLTGNKIEGFKNEELRLSDKIKDAPEVAAILPRCFSAVNCKKEGFISTCNNPGALKSGCDFSPAIKIKLTVVDIKDSLFTESRGVVNLLKERFPGLTVTYLYYPDEKSKKIIKDFHIKTLPAYVFSKDIEKGPAFDSLKENLEAKDGFYLLKPQMGGLTYYLERPKIPQRFDLFVGAYDKRTPELLQKLSQFKPLIHFLVTEKDNIFEAAKGPGEVEESLRMVCAEKYAPLRFLDYLSCRSASLQSAWWEDCLEGTPVEAIRACAKGQEGKELLRQNISLNKELQIIFGPTYLVDNQEIFSSRGVPSQEEFKKFLKK